MRTLQHPLPSGFGPATTSADVLARADLSGRTAIVTGGASGLGLESVRSLRAAGAFVIVPARDATRARAALASIDGVEVWPMDLIDPALIERFADAFLASRRPLHMLINNAGIMALPERTLDARGQEAQFAANHLGHFQLTARLWPALLSARGARVVSVSSRGHHYSPVVFDDLSFERRLYDPWLAYGQSKTANILFAVALDARGRAHGVRAFSVHPGAIAGTGLAKHVPERVMREIGMIDAQGKPIIDTQKRFKTAGMGAATQVWCATSPQLDGLGGVYCEDVDIARLLPDEDDAPTGFENGRRSDGVKAYAVDPEAAERLWTLSETLWGRMALGA